MTELERLDQAVEYFRRYDQKSSAIKQNSEIRNISKLIYMTKTTL